MKRFFLLLALLGATLAHAQSGPYWLTGTACQNVDTSASGVVAISVSNYGTSWSGTIQASVALGGDAATNVAVVPAGSVTSQTTITANGLYYATTYGAPTFRLCGNTITNTAQIKVFIGGPSVTAGVPLGGFGSVISTPAASGNPCVSPDGVLTSTSVAATSGTAAVQVIALSATQKVFVCSMSVVGTSGSTPTFSLVYGTGTNCAGGQATLVPAFGTTAGQLYAFANPVAVTPTGQAVCYLDGGTTPVQSVVLTYVQQ
jgi:hypothetical protein